MLLFAAAALGLVAGCANRAPAPGASPSVLPSAVEAGPPAVQERTGTIRRVGSFGFGIVPDSDPGTRYAPDRLPREFEVDGLRVVFTGSETPPPPGVRMWGTPFRLVSIRRAE